VILRAAGVPKVRELDWWRGFDDPSGVRITSVPVQHFANRGLCDRGGQLWTGYVIEGPGGRVYVAGDTGLGPHFAAAKARFGGFRLAVLPIGAYSPRWFMGPIHMSPEDAVAAHLALGAQASLGMHFGTFRLSDEGPADPVEDLAAAREDAGVAAPAFFTLAPGEGRDLPAYDGPPVARAPDLASSPPLAACGGPR
jgi:L-ascorbate metabolism protein UlaG (beta-lactamase superfamily)